MLNPNQGTCNSAQVEGHALMNGVVVSHATVFRCVIQRIQKRRKLTKPRRELFPKIDLCNVSQRALCEKPYRSSLPFCAPVWKLLRKFCINFGWDFICTNKCHWPAKHQHSNQVQGDRLPNFSGDVTSGAQKMLKKEICKRHLVKWQEVPSRKFTYPKFSQMFQKETFFSGNIFFLTFGECWKPYWSKTLLI